ncbi:MAG: hypothetical protein GY861_23745 [bacterium]|nr:hypothetical protein [bacterium]
MPPIVIVALRSKLVLTGLGILFCKTKTGKEIIETVKEGAKGVARDLERDYLKNKRLVNDIRMGRQK